ncbi:putative fasciclin-like arabinogalactan protein 20 [Carya illinoinensis]|uniref:FAS1 domain-containing protein n=1 Tax=Carya illinoinensis TaxID=32201 RepID=A0A8T1QLY8_CARIL|nr:putative fasciclin-like arabinogalactan protein 20 [Carya illinoinensis]KAG6655890.1 hypothetical protein CIPAW_05G247600 [Carya illinoinensis]
MASRVHLLLSLIIFSLFSLSSPLSSETISDAVHILADSGYVSMSLTLEAISKSTLLTNSTSLTIFAPSDSAFIHSGQPSLSLLQYHFSPLLSPLQTFRSLPNAAKIPTLFAGHSLTVTTSPSDDGISLNNVKVTRSPIFNRGLLVIFGIDEFFHPDFEVSVPVKSPEPNLGCGFPTANDTISFSGASSFGKVSGLLRCSGYSVMAEFLNGICFFWLSDILMAS